MSQKQQQKAVNKQLKSTEKCVRDKHQRAMRMMMDLARDELKKLGHTYPECMVKEVAEIFLKSQGDEMAVHAEDDRVILCDPLTGNIHRVVRNPNYTNPSHSLINIKEENDRLYKEVKHFAELPDDVLYNHNQHNEYMVLTMDEMIAELGKMNESAGSQLKLNDCDIRSTKIKGDKYYRVTFHHEKCGQPSRVEAVFGHFVKGFTYIFKADAFKAGKERILACVEHKATEFGKNTRWDITGVAYDKKKRGKKGRKVARKQKEESV